jgi:hypothetical protein
MTSVGHETALLPRGLVRPSEITFGRMPAALPGPPILAPSQALAMHLHPFSFAEERTDLLSRTEVRK